MADHGEVEYATATGNDYVEHESTYQTFIKLTAVSIVTVVTILIGLVLVGVKDAPVSGTLVCLIATAAGLIGLISELSWKAPGVVFVVSLLLWILL